MFGDERASTKEISLFLVWLQYQGSAVSETTKLETHVRMRNYAVTPPPTFANLITIESQAKHPILAQSVNRLLIYGKGPVRMCANADAPHP